MRLYVFTYLNAHSRIYIPSETRLDAFSLRFEVTWVGAPIRLHSDHAMILNMTERKKNIPCIKRKDAFIAM